MKVADLRRILDLYPDDTEVRVECCVTPGEVDFSHGTTDVFTENGIAVIGSDQQPRPYTMEDAGDDLRNDDWLRQNGVIE